MVVAVWRCLILALALTALLEAPAWAKSPPDKLIVQGPGLNAPVTISDAAALSGFSPWDRGFIAWNRGPATAPPPVDDRYTVSFYLDGRKIFVLDYVPRPAGAPGLIYVPGPSDPAFDLNKGTIIGASTDRWDPNGQWQYATPTWDSVLQGALRAHGAPLAELGRSAPHGVADLSRLLGHTPRPTAPGKQFWAIALPALGLLAGSAWALRRRRQHKAG